MDLTPYIRPLLPIAIAIGVLKLLEALIPVIRETRESGRPLPYRLRDHFLSPAEHSFCMVLRQAVDSWAVVCPKVSLGDLFYAGTGSRRENWRARNRIDRKHVDFLLCHPETMRPLVGIELDDSSHLRPHRQRRDRFVGNVFAAAGLPLAHLSVRYAYGTAELAETLRGAAAAGSSSATPQAPAATRAATTAAGAPPCPRCGRPMVQRMARRGGASGNPFWGCPDYPHCHGVRAID